MNLAITLDDVRACADSNPKGFSKDEQVAAWESGPAGTRAAVIRQAAMYLTGKRKLLTTNQAKLAKALAEGLPYLNVGLTLSPADEAAPFLEGFKTACAGASPGCIFACVGKGGHGKYDSAKLARIGRTVYRDLFPAEFDASERLELTRLRAKAERLGVTLAYRPDVASDFQDRTGGALDLVYGYTAVSAAMRQRDGVFRAYSRKETKRSHDLSLEWMAKGYPSAVVFNVKKGHALPDVWMGFPVIDGDKHDLWSLQPHPVIGETIGESYGRAGVVIGLRNKYDTIAQRDASIDSGFAVAVNA